MTDDLPFTCCDHCECPANDRTGHDDTCRICQEPDGRPTHTREPVAQDDTDDSTDLEEIA